MFILSTYAMQFEAFYDWMLNELDVRNDEAPLCYLASFERYSGLFDMQSIILMT